MSAPLQITRINPLSDRLEVEAEEMLVQQLDPADLVNRTIIIDADINSINLRTMHDAIYPDPSTAGSPSENLTVIIAPDVVVGSNSTTTPAVTVGEWPVGYPITLQVYGCIQGAGGDGGNGSRLDPQTEATDGEDGGTALYTRFNIVAVIEDGGAIYGGGGGGDGSSFQEEEEYQDSVGGGGGAGRTPGVAGISYAEADPPAEDGTLDEGGDGGALGLFKFGGEGGDPGQAGGPFGFGGAAGNAIDGVSFVTLTDTSPTGLLGPTVTDHEI